MDRIVNVIKWVLAFTLSQHIAAILKDKQQNLWVGTPRGGVNFTSLTKSNFEHIRPEATLQKTTSDELISISNII